MTLKAGDRIGRYEVAGLLGTGGMGEVYRARDPELGREVAIKVLPSDFAHDPDRLRRFEREARAIARLQHPNLLAIHDIGRHDGAPYLVCELLAGQTLRERLDAGSPPLRQVLDWASQIADGLAAAHDAGVLHRDLKPSNLFVGHDGQVKILDFGLAKVTAREQDGGSELSTFAEISRQGIVLGTAAYMAPEQAAGGAVDHRADQFSLGVVLYEALAGRRPFGGATQAEMLTAILRDDPEPLSRAAPEVQAPVRWIVERCLAREPAGRYASTRDLVGDLATLSSRLSELSSAGAAAPGPAREPGAHRFRLLPLAGLAGLLALTGFVAFVAGRSATEPTSLEYRRITFRRGTVTAARFEAGGEGVFYSAAWEGRPSHIHLQRPGTHDPIELGPPGSRLLSVSADGDLLVLVGLEAVGPFLQAGELARMPIAGAPRSLDQGVVHAVFDADGKLGAVVRKSEGRLVLEFPPGTPRRSSRGLVLDLRLSPDGERLALIETPGRGRDRGSIVVLDRAGDEIDLGGEIGWGLAWSSSGKEIWYSDATSVLAVTPEGRRRRVATFPADVTLYDISPSGQVLLGVEERRYEMVGRPADGEERELTWRAWSVPFDLSADGETILFNEYTGGLGLVALRGFGRDPPVALGAGFGESLSPTGDWVLSAPPWSPRELSLIATGSGERRDLVVGEIDGIGVAAFAPDGRTLLLNANLPDEGNRIFRFDPDTGVLESLTPEGVEFGFFSASPDERWLAVPSVEGVIVVYSLEGGEPKRLDLDEQPIRWSVNGRSLYTAPLAEIPAALRRVDLIDGTRELIALLKPADPAGVTQISPVAVTPDGSAYVYGYVRRLSDLFIVEGMR